MSKTATFLNNDLYEYMLQHSLRPEPILQSLADETAKLPQARMLSSMEQLQFMQLLVKLTNAKNCIEAGVFTGISALAVAMALPQDGKIIACDINQEWADIGHKYWEKAGVAAKIDLRIAPAEETLQNLIAQNLSSSFDFCYIDANKSAYPQYYELCLELTRPNGLILVDNAFMGGSVLHDDKKDKPTNAVKQLNSTLQKDSRIDFSLLPLGDGLAIARKC